MDDQVNHLVEKTWKKFQDVPRSQRLMIAVSGIPGSGTFFMKKDNKLCEPPTHTCF
jgi:hypothetical protein